MCSTIKNEKCFTCERYSKIDYKELRFLTFIIIFTFLLGIWKFFEIITATVQLLVSRF